MPTNDLRLVPFDALDARSDAPPARWLWDGYLMPGDVTVLTSQWKTGKTTLLTGMFRRLAAGGEFLGRGLCPGRAWIVSEESVELWADRVRGRPVGPHVQLLARPFRGRPTFADWDRLIDRAADAATAGDLDLFVVDPLASFLPGRCESDAATLLEALYPLHRLTAAGAAVLLLHHPRKQPAEPGASARGSGALLGFADVSVELTRFSQLASDEYRRLLFAQSRRPGTPARLAYELDPATGAFRPVADPHGRQFADNWQAVRAVLAAGGSGLTCQEVLAGWPADLPRPSLTTVRDWLNRGCADRQLRRDGRGTKDQPWRYRLLTAFDRALGELPPLG